MGLVNGNYFIFTQHVVAPVSCVCGLLMFLGAGPGSTGFQTDDK
jgi:hypothetical protein